MSAFARSPSWWLTAECVMRSEDAISCTASSRRFTMSERIDTRVGDATNLNNCAAVRSRLLCAEECHAPSHTVRIRHWRIAAVFAEADDPYQTHIQLLREFGSLGPRVIDCHAAYL